MSALTPARRWLAACAAAGFLLLMAAPVAHGATPPCRVRNVTQDTSGRSLIRMVEKARDGDRLRVRGTCPGPVVISADIVIRGVGEAPTLTGRDTSLVVKVAKGATATIDGVTVQKGLGTDFGAGIWNRGSLTLVSSVIRWNRNPTFDSVGGGIGNSGTLAVIGSRIAGNRAGWYGAGLANHGRAVVRETRIVGNMARTNAGGVFNVYGASLTLVDSRVARNRAVYGAGGGIANSGGELALEGSVVRENRAADAGGIVNWDEGTVTLDASSSVTDNIPDDCVGTDAC